MRQSKPGDSLHLLLRPCDSLMRVKSVLEPPQLGQDLPQLQPLLDLGPLPFEHSQLYQLVLSAFVTPYRSTGYLLQLQHSPIHKHVLLLRLHRQRTVTATGESEVLEMLQMQLTQAIHETHQLLDVLSCP